MKNQKLSKVQNNVIKTMQSGWELGLSQRISGEFSAWLQIKVGHGGKCQNITMATFNSLKNKGLLIEVRKNYPTDVYHLSESGKAYQCV